ncbi:hypothetical protein HYY75_06800 [bacterium]|nr:hypothetical protein [bacterium]
MNDQAYSLRQLKRQIEDKNKNTPILPESFLSNISRPTHFSTVLLFNLDKINKTIPPIQQWFSRFLQDPRQTILWDQGGLLSVNSFHREDMDERQFYLESLEFMGSQLWVIPRMTQFLNYFYCDENEKIKFLKSFFVSLNQAKELWITLNFSEFSFSQAIVHSADLISILVPDYPDSILRCYEAVKSIRLSGFFSPICLIIERPQNGVPFTTVFERINSVSNKFLSLDLGLGGELEICNPATHETSELPIRSIMKSQSQELKDFMFSFAERFLYPAPGDVLENNG